MAAETEEEVQVDEELAARLWDWRDGLARKLDVSPDLILNEDQFVAVVKCKPRSVREMRGVMVLASVEDKSDWVGDMLRLVNDACATDVASAGSDIEMKTSSSLDGGGHEKPQKRLALLDGFNMVGDSVSGHGAILTGGPSKKVVCAASTVGGGKMRSRQVAASVHEAMRSQPLLQMIEDYASGAGSGGGVMPGTSLTAMSLVGRKRTAASRTRSRRRNKKEAALAAQAAAEAKGHKKKTRKLPKRKSHEVIDIPTPAKETEEKEGKVKKPPAKRRKAGLRAGDNAIMRGAVEQLWPLRADGQQKAFTVSHGGQLVGEAKKVEHVQEDTAVPSSKKKRKKKKKTRKKNMKDKDDVVQEMSEQDLWDMAPIADLDMTQKAGKSFDPSKEMMG